MDRRGRLCFMIVLGLLSLIFLMISPAFSSPDLGKEKKVTYAVPQGGILYYTPRKPEEKKFISVACFDRIFPFFQPDHSGEAVALIAVDLYIKPSVVSCEVRSEVQGGNRRAESILVKVIDGGFKTQELNVPRAMVDLDSETLQRVRREKKAVDSLWEDSAPRKLWQGNFIVPVEGTPKGTFGLRRVFNGQPRSPHTGEDFKAPLGATVFSTNHGVVKLTGDHFFSGKSIFIDHGLGLYTMYFHLSEILVQEGQFVDKGTFIGRVGSSGRATGPHLHWGVRLNNARVDPISLTRLRLGN